MVKSLRNWAIAQARKAERRGMFTGRREAGDDGGDVKWEPDDVASDTVITSSMIKL